jgi:hypothetical protein
MAFWFIELLRSTVIVGNDVVKLELFSPPGTDFLCTDSMTRECYIFPERMLVGPEYQIYILIFDSSNRK